MSVEIEQIINGLQLGEGPHWDVDTQSLYFVDVFGDNKLIGKYDYSNGKYTKLSVGPIACHFVIPVENRLNQFIVPFKNQLTIIEWDGTSDNHYKIIKQLDKVPYSINDAKIDPAGRLWTGTCNIHIEDFFASRPDGELYCLDSKCTLTKHLDNIKISNGLTFNSQTNKFYHIDSLKYCIDQYDYNNETGTICNGRILFTLQKHDISGIPDGMTIDSDGNLWVAIIRGGCIIKIDGVTPEKLLDTIEMPTSLVTSVAFGGPNLDELFVTTGSVNSPDQLSANPDIGGVYKVTGLGVKGLPMGKFVLE